MFNIFYNIVNVSLYLIIVLRYHETFKLSAYKSSNTLYRIIFALIAGYFGCYSLWIAVYATNYDHFNLSSSAFMVLFGAEVLLLMMDLILTVIITFLFCRNLVLLTVSITNHQCIRKQTVEITATPSTGGTAGGSAGGSAGGHNRTALTSSPSSSSTTSLLSSSQKSRITRCTEMTEIEGVISEVI